MKIIIARHGETKGNTKKLAEGGGSEGSLTKKGHEQARKLAKRLESEHIDVIVVSPLNRTRQTAEPIIKTHPKAEVILDPELREMDFGILEGITYDEYIEHKKKSGLSNLDFKRDGGESYNDVYARAKRFTEQALKKYAGKTVLMVSHGVMLRQIIANLLNQQVDADKRNSHDNTGISVIEIKKDGNHKVILKNCTKHLLE